MIPIVSIRVRQPASQSSKIPVEGVVLPILRMRSKITSKRLDEPHKVLFALNPIHHLVNFHYGPHSDK